MITMILLGVVFLAVVVPQALTARSDRQREFLDSIQLHAGAMPGLDEPPVPAPPGPRTRSTIARRKSVFVFLLVALGVSAIPAIVTPAKATLVTQLAVDNCFLAYVGLLVRWRDARAPVRAPAPVTAPDLVIAPTSVRPVLRAS
ncbi:MAG: hypothetical protein M3011_05990 [Actinomycetota bacterium]|nr:hypothetical protein [Actinomycetota bacterium]